VSSLHRNGMRLSVLDYVPVLTGQPMSASITSCRRLAQWAQALGYHRFWLTEHHNAAAFASSATAVLIGYVAEGTRDIRVGAGGMMMSNHSALHVAEQFGTLATLYPDRIDLGVGCASGTDPQAAALLRHSKSTPDLTAFLGELNGFLAEAVPSQPVRAVPGAGLEVPTFVLGAGEGTAAVAGTLGLPFAFAGHLRAGAGPALAAYRRAFRPVGRLAAPHALVSINVVAAESLAEAEVAATSWLQRLLDVHRGRPAPLREPVPDMTVLWTLDEARAIEPRRGFSIIGGPQQVREGLDQLVAECRPDEILVNSEIHSPSARRHSLQVFAETFMSMPQLRDCLP